MAKHIVFSPHVTSMPEPCYLCDLKPEKKLVCKQTREDKNKGVYYLHLYFSSDFRSYFLITRFCLMIFLVCLQGLLMCLACAFCDKKEFHETTWHSEMVRDLASLDFVDIFVSNMYMNISNDTICLKPLRCHCPLKSSANLVTSGVACLSLIGFPQNNILW